MSDLKKILGLRSEFMNKNGELPNYLIVGSYEHYHLRHSKEFKQAQNEQSEPPTNLFGCRVLVDESIRGYHFGVIR